MLFRIVIAEWQNIVYSELLPLLVGKNTMEDQKYQLSVKARTTYNPHVNPHIYNSFATAAFRSVDFF